MPSLASSAILFSLLTLAPLAASAAPASDYETVRRIAMRDPRVQEAFARANQKLDEKIVQIDPTLSSYVRTHPSGRGAPATTAASRPAAPAKKPSIPPTGRAHVVKPGETLSSIAARYGVSSQNLQGTNRIRDERKLKVGQTLIVPAKP